VWWPPGPRPKQAELYRRRLGLLEAALFAAGVEALALGIIIGTAPLARAGAFLLAGSALLTAAAVALTWRSRSHGER
jgi:hypothetical protein